MCPPWTYVSALIEGARAGAHPRRSFSEGKHSGLEWQGKLAERPAQRGSLGFSGTVGRGETTGTGLTRRQNLCRKSR